MSAWHVPYLQTATDNPFDAIIAWSTLQFIIQSNLPSLPLVKLVENFSFCSKFEGKERKAATQSQVNWKRAKKPQGSLSSYQLRRKKAVSPN